LTISLLQFASKGLANLFFRTIYYHCNRSPIPLQTEREGIMSVTFCGHGYNKDPPKIGRKNLGTFVIPSRFDVGKHRISKNNGAQTRVAKHPIIRVESS
jgi:hypothetical protein